MLAAAAPASAGDELIVVAFGDSLTSGHGIGRGQAYPAVLQAKLDAGKYVYHVVNAGISGDTTANGVRRIDRALGPGARVLILGLGVNDGLRGVPIATVQRNLETMIQRADQNGSGW
jgi:acyl-CoA thioesterase-1